MTALLPGLATEIIITVTAGSVTSASAYVVYKARQVNTNTILLQGVDGVEELDGLVGSVEMLNREVEGNSETIEEVEEDMKNIRSILSDHTDLINDLDQTAKENQEDIEEVKEKMGEIHTRIISLRDDIAKRNNDS